MTVTEYLENAVATQKRLINELEANELALARQANLIIADYEDQVAKLEVVRDLAKNLIATGVPLDTGPYDLIVSRLTFRALADTLEAMEKGPNSDTQEV